MVWEVHVRSEEAQAGDGLDWVWDSRGARDP